MALRGKDDKSWLSERRTRGRFSQRGSREVVVLRGMDTDRGCQREGREVVALRGKNVRSWLSEGRT